jgi:hypothetical protein
MTATAGEIVVALLSAFELFLPEEHELRIEIINTAAAQ